MHHPILLVLLAATCLQAADPVTPPVVIRSEPLSGAEAVDPALTELRVTFDQPMQDGTWSWTTLGVGAFPEIAGAIRYLEDGRTCVLPVRLKPDTVYVLGINSPQHLNFRTRDGRSALPWVLRFATGPASADADATAALGRAVAADLAAGRFAAVTARFDATMRDALSKEQLGAVWTEAERMGGAFVAWGAASTVRRDGYAVVTIPATWQRWSAVLEVAFDGQDRIAGLFLRPAPPSVRLGLWRWDDPAWTRPTGATVSEGRLRIAVRGAATIALGTWERPGISEARFALAGRLRCSGVAQAGHLELWTVLADGRRFFSRTLGEGGPQGRIFGDQDWREIQLPADATGSEARPVRLELNLVLPAGGSVEIGPLQLCQYAPGAPMAPVLPDGG